MPILLLKGIYEEVDFEQRGINLVFSPLGTE